MLSAEVGVHPRNGFELDEMPEPCDVIQMDADVLPQEQVPAFLDGAADTKRRVQSGAETIGIVDAHYPVAALSLLRLVSPPVLNEMRLARPFFPQLQRSAWDVEVGVALPDHALVGGLDQPAHVQ